MFVIQAKSDSKMPGLGASFRKLLLIFCGVVVCLGASACQSSTTSYSSSEVPLGDIPSITNYDQIVRPIDNYALTVDQQMAFRAQEESRISDCMQKQGAPGWKGYSPQFLRTMYTSASASGRAYGEGYGSFVPLTAAKYGYDLPPETDASGSDFGAGSFSQDAYNDCWTKIGTKFPGTEASSAPGSSPKSAAADHRYLEQVKKWSACMKQSGYEFNDPDTARQAAMNSRTGEPNGSGSVAEMNGYPTANEMAQAQTDMDCKIETNLIGYWLAVQTQYDNQWISDNRAALDDWKQQVANFIAGK
jgi:hypothetical protein